MSVGPVIEIEGLVKQYGGLRPLRVAALRVDAGARVALVGLDAPAAEVLINAITGATLPDRGALRVFGRATSEIADADDWMSLLDRFGIVSDRAVLLDAFTVAQNVAMAFGLDVDPIPAETLARVRAVAEDAGLTPPALDVRVAESSPLTRARVHLARAIALDPAALVLEHASARLPRDDVPRFASDVARAADARRLTTLALTMDEGFARAMGARVLAWDAASGALREKRATWWRR